MRPERPVKNKNIVRILQMFGIQPKPTNILLTQLFIIVVCLFGVIYFLSNDDSASKYGNYDDFREVLEQQ